LTTRGEGRKEGKGKVIPKSPEEHKKESDVEKTFRWIKVYTRKVGIWVTHQ
jgi:hypothetical protein